MLCKEIQNNHLTQCHIGHLLLVGSNSIFIIFNIHSNNLDYGY
jgi:hypothetical protein